MVTTVTMNSQLTIEDRQEIAENRLTVKYHLQPFDSMTLSIPTQLSGTAPAKSTIVSGFGTTGACENAGAEDHWPETAEVIRTWGRKQTLAISKLTESLDTERPVEFVIDRGEVRDREDLKWSRYPGWKKEERWIDPLPDVHDQPELQAQNRQLYEEWNQKLNEIAKTFEPTDRYTFDSTAPATVDIFCITRRSHQATPRLADT